jgi:hypothetical protein
MQVYWSHETNTKQVVNIEGLYEKNLVAESDAVCGDMYSFCNLNWSFSLEFLGFWTPIISLSIV